MQNMQEENGVRIFQDQVLGLYGQIIQSAWKVEGGIVMGVIPINFSHMSEGKIKSLPRGTRSEYVNRLVEDKIRLQLSDNQLKQVIDCSYMELISEGVRRAITNSNKDSEEVIRLMELRNMLLDHMHKVMKVPMNL